MVCHVTVGFRGGRVVARRFVGVRHGVLGGSGRLARCGRHGGDVTDAFVEPHRVVVVTDAFKFSGETGRTVERFEVGGVRR